MISPIVRYILLTIACAVMATAIIWIGRHMIAGLSEFIENDKEDKHE